MVLKRAEAIAIKTLGLECRLSLYLAVKLLTVGTHLIFSLIDPHMFSGLGCKL